MTEIPPVFDSGFIRQFEQLLAWRRDVREFKPDPVAPDLVNQLLSMARYAPSVGLSQPWRFVLVEKEPARKLVQANFEQANRLALQGYEGERAKIYSTLKLAGLKQAPVQFVACCQQEATQGHGLGRQTMPETLQYSVVAALQIIWLAARAYGLGLGWLSILDPEQLRQDLELPMDWHIVGFFCLGWPEEQSNVPLLEQKDWEQRRDPTQWILCR